MPFFLPSSAENRLLHLTLEELNKQREAAGIKDTNVGTVYNKRVAEANAARANQPTRSTGTAVTDPAAASLQRLRDTQAYLTQNPTVDPTGKIASQALEGQKAAESYVAPRNMGNEEYYKTQAGILNAAQQVGKNAGLGLQSSVTPDRNALTGFNDPNVIGKVQAASSSGLEQSAINNMRKNNYTEDQIRMSLSDPARMENIRQTMSNTGLGGTARDSAVLTPAQAQQLLATSRNVSQRKQAQGVLDAAATEGISRTTERQVGTDKNGNPIYQTVTNPNYEKEVEAKRQRMSQDQENALRIQENTDKLKNFTAKVDTTAFTETQKQMNDALSMIKNLSPTLQAAVLPTLLSLQESNNNAIKTANELASTLPTDKQIESNYGTLENYILSSEKKMQEMAESNKQLQLDIAKYNKDALEIDKRLLDHDAQVAQQKQLQANIENEKRLRRQLGKLGITTDVQGLNFLQDEVQKGVDSLNNLKTANNLVSLKAQLAIGDGYALDVRRITGEYDANTLQIKSQTTEALQKVKSSISMDKKEKDKELRSILEKAQQKKDENAKEARNKIYDANIKMIDEVNKLRDDERADAQNAMSNLLTLRGQGVQNINGAMLKSIQDRLPGIDVNAILKDPTTAALKEAQKQSTDLNTSSSSFKDPLQASIMDGANLAANGMSVAAGDVFRNEVARKLRSGDTEGAKKYMLTQIANEIKGPALTEYNARADQEMRIGSILKQMEANPNFDYSGFEYLKQKTLSSPYIPGDASAEYFSLLAPIAQLSAEITHGLSGAAVSPSEWSRLTTFLPQGGEGHDVLKAKLQNLQKYAGWLNEAHLARAANLPVPPEPDLPGAVKSDNAEKKVFSPGQGTNDVIHDTIAPANGVPLSYINNFRLTQNYGSTWDKEHGFMNGPHMALDLAPKVRGEIVAVPALRGGKVIAMNNIKGLGNSVTVQDDDGNIYEYGHLASQMVKVGDTIDADRPIGIMGNTGSTDGGVHLHLAVKDSKGTYVDPRDYLS